MFAYPRIIESGVVSDEIQKKCHLAGMQFLPDTIERIPGSNARIRHVLHYRVRRTDYVRRRPTGQCAVEIGGICGILEADLPGEGASLPHAHEPDHVKT